MRRRAGLRGRGTVEEWRDGAAKLASGHVLPVLAISAALAGPLLHLAGHEGGGVHFFGPIVHRQDDAVADGGERLGPRRNARLCPHWRATANGLEGAAAGATDTALILDEMGQVEGASWRRRSTRSPTARARRGPRATGHCGSRRTWRVLTFSSGEVPVDAKLAEDRG